MKRSTSQIQTNSRRTLRITSSSSSQSKCPKIHNLYHHLTTFYFAIASNSMLQTKITSPTLSKSWIGRTVNPSITINIRRNRWESRKNKPCMLTLLILEASVMRTPSSSRILLVISTDANQLWERHWPSSCSNPQWLKTSRPSRRPITSLLFIICLPPIKSESLELNLSVVWCPFWELWPDLLMLSQSLS